MSPFENDRYERAMILYSEAFDSPLHVTGGGASARPSWEQPPQNREYGIPKIPLSVTPLPKPCVHLHGVHSKLSLSEIS